MFIFAGSIYSVFFMKNFYLLLFTCFVTVASAQINVSISAIQGSGSTTAYQGQIVATSGVVTSKYVGSGMINGFFIQDAAGDGNPATSDGIFVYSSNTTISIGDKIQLTAKASEYNNRTQLSEVSNMQIISQNSKLPVA